MKYKIEDTRSISRKEVDVTKYFPKAEGKIVIWVKRLSGGKRIEVLSFMGEDEKDFTGYSKTMIFNLLHGVETDHPDFPFERWDELTIKEIDERCPDLIETILNNFMEMNRPLAKRNETMSET
jgi:hypothetical protein